MASNLVVNKEFIPASSQWKITAHIEEGGSIPSSCFLFENDEGTLGEFYAVCSFENLSRPVFYEGIPSFGNRYVRHNELVRQYSTELDADTFVTTIRFRLEQLDVEISSKTNTTTTYVIGN